MKKVWNDQKVKMPEAAPIINAGLDKLEEYCERADLVPAYVLAMGKYRFSLALPFFYMQLPAVNPEVKFEWIHKTAPEKLSAAKELFIREVFSHCLDLFFS